MYSLSRSSTKLTSKSSPLGLVELPVPPPTTGTPDGLGEAEADEMVVVVTPVAVALLPVVDPACDFDPFLLAHC